MWNIYLHFEIQYLWKYNYIFGHHGNHANCTLRKTTLKRSLAGQPSVFQDVLLDVGRHNLTTCHVLNRKGKGIGNGIQYMLLSSTSVYIAFLEWKIIHEFSTKSSQPAFYSQSNLYWLICCSIRSSIFCRLNHVEPEFIHMDSPDFFSQHSSQRSVYLKRFLVTFSPNLHFPVCGFQQLNLKDEIARQIVHVKLRFEEYACNKPPPASWAHASFTI